MSNDWTSGVIAKHLSLCNEEKLLLFYEFQCSNRCNQDCIFIVFVLF